MSVRSLRVMFLLVLLGCAVEGVAVTRLGELPRSYALSSGVLTKRYGFDSDFWKSFVETLVEHETSDGIPYGVLSSTVDFDQIQVCIWLPKAHDDHELGVFLTQFHFQSLALDTIRVALPGDVTEVSLSASSLARLGVNYGELFRELCGASSGFTLLDAGFRVKVSQESNELGSFYISQLSRDDVCSRLLASEKQLKTKYDAALVRLVSRHYLKRFLTQELTGHRMSKSHLRQTYQDLYCYRGGGLLRLRLKGVLSELEALRLLAYRSWLSRWSEMGLEESVRRELESSLPSARESLGQVWRVIPGSWRQVLAGGLRRVGEGVLVDRLGIVKQGH